MKLTAEITYRDDVSQEKPWGTVSSVVELKLASSDGLVIEHVLENEVAAVSRSPTHLLRRFLGNIDF